MNGKRVATGLTRLVRRVGLDRNPLRRRTDRIEIATVWTAVVLLLAALPAALVIGFGVYHQNMTVVHQQESQRQNVAALLTGAAPVTEDGQDGQTVFVSQAQWTTSNGAHSGLIQVPVNTQAQSVVHIWTDASGAQVQAPLAWEYAFGRGALSGVTALTAFGLVLWGAVGLARWQLNRRRFRDWEAEWQHIDPRWTQPAG